MNSGRIALVVFVVLVAALSAFVVHRAVRNLMSLLGARREQRHLDRSGVRARGLVRVERAALPSPEAGGYPLHPRGRPRSGPKILTAVLPLLVIVPVVGVLGTISLLPADLIPRFAPLALLLLPLAGVGLIVHALRAVGVGHLGTRRYTAEAEGTVTDCWTRFTHVASNSRTPTYPFTVLFRASDGREVHGCHPFASPAYHPSVGQRVRVRHDPEHPSRFSVRDFTPG